MRLLAVFLSFVIVSLAQDPRELLNQGVQAYKSARYADAAGLFQKAVDANPDNANARLYLATSWMSRYIPGGSLPGNSDFARRAEAEFQEVLRLDPNNKTALASLASLSYQEGQAIRDQDEKSRKLDESRSWYQRLIAIDPQNKEAYYSLAVIDWSKWYPVWMQARTSMGMKPEQSGPLVITATRRDLAAQYSGLIEDGIANLDKALALDPQYDDAMAYKNLLIRERADLRDTPEEYRKDVDLADQWVHKALETKRASAISAAQSVTGSGGGGGSRAYTSTGATTPQRIRVGGNVQAMNLSHKVDPVYPPLAKSAQIQGTIRFTAIIGKDGRIQNLTLVSGHPLLVDAAQEAVKQWEYKPTLLNGQPVEVVTAIDVSFTLSQ